MIDETAGPTTIFLDANVLVSAAWREGCEIAQIWQMTGVRLITSNYVMGEVQRNLPRIEQIERLRKLMRSVRVLTFDLLPEIDGVALPPKDLPVLAGAVQAKADFLVSGDKKHFGPLFGRIVCGVRIIAPTELLSALRAGGR
ncbi:MAG: putative toxin-antitoxin system toxin component, PIN family [Terracidiphilus sp.]